VRISIGLRLFLSVLLAIFGVVATAVVLIRENVNRGVGEYALNVELGRLDGLAGTVEANYARQGWSFLPAGAAARRQWPGQDQRSGAAPSPPPAPPAPPTPPDGGPDNPRRRVTLLDAGGAYLAGRPPGAETSVRRTLYSQGQPIGYLALSQPPRPPDPLARAFLQKLNDNLLTIVLASLALSAIAATLLAANFRKPIGNLARGADALAAGRYDMRLPAQRGDELGDLARSFNQLASRLDDAETTRRKWVADTSHELRTPLSVLRAQLEALQDGVRQPDSANIAAMLRQVLALNGLVDQLYTLAKSDVGEPGYQFAPLDVWALALDEAQAFGDKLAAAQLRLDIGAGTPARLVAGDGGALRQVFANLLENCVRYSAAGGVVHLHGEAIGADAVIVVDDSAPGVADADLPHLAERFFRVEHSRSRATGGAGLGLALCRRIVEDHGGRLTFDHSPLGGLRVTMRLPGMPA
jgi:two-component system sensor histidine kinase BaeS